jgi:hypothetical protein
MNAGKAAVIVVLAATRAVNGPTDADTAAVNNGAVNSADTDAVMESICPMTDAVLMPGVNDAEAADVDGARVAFTPPVNVPAGGAKVAGTDAVAESTWAATDAVFVPGANVPATTAVTPSTAADTTPVFVPGANVAETIAVVASIEALADAVLIPGANVAAMEAVTEST